MENNLIASENNSRVINPITDVAPAAFESHKKIDSEGTASNNRSGN